VANQGNNATYGNRVKKIRSDNNAVLWTVTGFSSPYSVSVNPADDTCWVADYNNNRVVRIDASGNIDWTMSGFSRPMAVSVSPNL
jgi:DNA-binding beta-propeller fold protein YncE